MRVQPGDAMCPRVHGFYFPLNDAMSTCIMTQAVSSALYFLFDGIWQMPFALLSAPEAEKSGENRKDGDVWRDSGKYMPVTCQRRLGDKNMRLNDKSVTGYIS